MARLVGDFSKENQKNKKKPTSNTPPTIFLGLALPSISDIIPGQWNPHLHITCQILRSTCKTILLSPDDTNLIRKPTNNTACQSVISFFIQVFISGKYLPTAAWGVKVPKTSKRWFLTHKAHCLFAGCVCVWTANTLEKSLNRRVNKSYKFWNSSTNCAQKGAKWGFGNFSREWY